MESNLTLSTYNTEILDALSNWIWVLIALVIVMIIFGIILKVLGISETKIYNGSNTEIKEESKDTHQLIEGNND